MRKSFFPLAILLGSLVSCTTIQYGVDEVPTYKELQKFRQALKIGAFEDATVSPTNQAYAGPKKYVEMGGVLYEHNDRKKYTFGIPFEFVDIFKDHLRAAGVRIDGLATNMVIRGSISNFESYVEYNPEYEKKVKDIRFTGGIFLGRFGITATNISEAERKGFPLRQINQVGFSIQVMQHENPIFDRYYEVFETNFVKYQDNEDAGVYSYANEAMKKLVNRFTADLKELVSFLQ